MRKKGWFAVTVSSALESGGVEYLLVKQMTKHFYLLYPSGAPSVRNLPRKERGEPTVNDFVSWGYRNGL